MKSSPKLIKTNLKIKTNEEKKEALAIIYYTKKEKFHTLINNSLSFVCAHAR